MESCIDRAQKIGQAAAERQKAETLLNTIAESIADDWTAYQKGGVKFPDDGSTIKNRDKTAVISDFNAIRRTIADQIIILQKALEPYRI